MLKKKFNKKNINVNHNGKYVRKTSEKSIKKLIFITCFFLIIFILSIIYTTSYHLKIYKEQFELNSLLDNIQIDENAIENANETDDEPKITERMLKLQKLQKTNSDIIGWIEIEGTQINYPVLQSSDNDFYMNHNYKKKFSSSGSIFLDKDYNWDIPSSNLLIYGHNMNNGTMFQNLLKYKDKSFYKKHPTIRFTTEKEDALYDIIAVFKSRVYYKSEKDVFRYYFFINAKNEEEYNSYVNSAKKASLYDTGKTAKFNSQLITLSTCAYHTADGRFVVVACKSDNKIK